jgi:hypothetical protein
MRHGVARDAVLISRAGAELVRRIHCASHSAARLAK